MRNLVLALAVLVGGCGVDEQRQRVVDRQSRFDSLIVESQMAHRRAMAAFDHGMTIIDGALVRADRDSMQSRIDRLAADSARCAERHAYRGKQVSITLCGDTIWSTGCERGGPDSIHFADPKCENHRQSFKWGVR